MLLLLVILTEAKFIRRKNKKLKGALIFTVTFTFGQVPSGNVRFILAVSLKFEKSGLSGITAWTVASIGGLVMEVCVTAARVASLAAFCTTWDTKKATPQSTAAPTRITRRGKINATSTMVWPLFFSKIFFINIYRAIPQSTAPYQNQQQKAKHRLKSQPLSRN